MNDKCMKYEKQQNVATTAAITVTVVSRSSREPCSFSHKGCPGQTKSSICSVNHMRDTVFCLSTGEGYPIRSHTSSSRAYRSPAGCGWYPSRVLHTPQGHPEESPFLQATVRDVVSEFVATGS
ncbi:hypothetical protein ElyMa_004143500 [Elysia marginata]|uniref:Uncharacterized protein n=1 Tax=Elysia marginata TaxID=1093978 RepID=A0AAV4GF42_9GAST|nr:hypothetical protein ElyMa_004143500 [Elysia marginata]